MSVEVETVEKRDAFERLRENREAAVQMGKQRNDHLGAMVRVLVALAEDERPTNADLIAAGLPTPDEMEGQ